MLTCFYKNLETSIMAQTGELKLLTGSVREIQTF